MADALLDSVALLAHPSRVTALWKYGRDTPADDVGAVIADLDARDGDYEHRIAATLAAASSNTDWAAAHLADTNPSLRRQAIRLSHLLPDNAIHAALRDAPAATRYDLYRTLKGRTALADDLVERVRSEWRDEEATRLLHWCSEPVVQRRLPTLLLALAHTRHWRPLALTYPHLLHAALAADLEQSVKDGIDPTAWWTRYDMGVGMLVKHADMAGEALHLLTAHRHNSHQSAFYNYTAEYARLEPQRLLRLVSDLEDSQRLTYFRPSNRVRRRLARSGLPEVDAWTNLITSLDGGHDLPLLLKAVAPSQRVKMYELGKGPPSRPIEVFCDANLVDALPTFYLTGLARRALPDLKDAPWVERLPVLAYLPPGEVTPEFLEGTRRADPEDRRSAWQWYIANARFFGAKALAAAAAEAARRLRNEQQPVRAYAINALASVPARLLNVEALGHLTTVMTDAIEARDQTGEWRVLNEIAIAVLVAHADSPPHIQWGLGSLQTLAKHAPTVSMSSLTLRKGQETLIWNAFKSFIHADAAKNEYRSLIALGQALGKRAANVPELQEALWGAITSNKPFISTSAVALYLEPKALRTTRVAELIANDESVVAHPAVADIIAWQRTDLLRPALGSMPNGHFSRGSTWVFPAPPQSLRRWTPAQTSAYLSQLDACVDDPDMPSWEKMNALKRLKELPGGLEFARALASKKGNDVRLIESGLGALVTSPADLGLLYSFAGGDRARVAMYTASGAARRERPSALEPLLADLLTRTNVKVTSKKEAIRQATSLLPLDVACPLLARLASKPDLHRDVQVACVAAATRLLFSEAGWSVIQSALTAEPVVRQAICGLSPLDLPQNRARDTQPS